MIENNDSWFNRFFNVSKLLAIDFSSMFTLQYEYGLFRIINFIANSIITNTKTVFLFGIF
jgi:hypothetical protein